jgi:hypothetical protein
VARVVCAHDIGQQHKGEDVLAAEWAAGGTGRAAPGRQASQSGGAGARIWVAGSYVPGAGGLAAPGIAF